MKRYILNITLLLAALLTTSLAWGVDITGTWAGGTLANGTYRLTGNTTLSNKIMIASARTVTIDLNGYILSGGISGSLIEVANGGKLTIQDSRRTSENKGSLNAKGLWMPNNSGNIILKGGVICNTYLNDTTNRKAIQVSGTCIVEYANIVGCFAGDIGAAVTATSSGQFTMQGGQVSYNYTRSSSLRAGAVYGEPRNSNNPGGSSLNISNTTLSYNISEGWGGAICGFRITLSNANVMYNQAEKGGGVTVRGPSSSLTISNSEISYNDATSSEGGGIYAPSEEGVADLMVSITGSKINYNEILNKTGYGGGIAIPMKSGNVSVEIDNTEINYNYASVNGGGIRSLAPTTIRNSKINHNRCMSTASSTEAGYGRGGGFHFTGDSSFNLINTEVAYNAAMYYGGGGQVDNLAKLTMSGTSSIHHNEAVLHGAGGLHLTSSATFTLESGDISYNKCYTVGGAIHTSYGCSLILNGGTIDNNFANQRGGGIHINTGGSLVIDGTNIIGNEVARGKDLQYAEVYVNSDGIRQWRNLTFNESADNTNLDDDGFYNNTGYGGGILIDSGTFTMNKGIVSGNKAEIGGGGVALVMIRLGEGDNLKDFANMKVVQFTMNDGQIYNNESDGDGAGILILKNKIPDLIDQLPNDKKLLYKQHEKYNELSTGRALATIVKGDFRQNNSAKLGGAIYLQEGDAYVTQSATFSANSAKSGGAIYMGNGTFTVNGTATMNGNKATAGNGGGIYLGGGTFHVASAGVANIGSISAPNTASGNGGGIYCAGTFDVDGKMDVAYNQAANGGGICVMNGTVTLPVGEASKFLNNTATALGGGLYVDNSNATFNGGIFRENKAKSGGAVAAKATDAKTITLNATMENNEATQGNGGGIYLSGPVTMTFADGLIRANTAKGTLVATGGTAKEKDTEVTGVGGGIFMANGATLKFVFGSTPQLGIYNNAATNAGADICANGKSTTIDLPNVSAMTLAGFDVPADQNTLTWMEDYFTGDTSIAGTDAKPTIRYEAALAKSNADNQFDIVPYQVAAGTGKTDYLCLDLGYELVFVNLITKGLDAIDNAAVTVSYLKSGESEPTVYRKVLFMGEQTRVVALPTNSWKIDVTDWSSKYESMTLTPSPVDGYIAIKKNQNDEITLRFAKSTDSKVANVHQHQHRKVNRMVVPSN